MSPDLVFTARIDPPHYAVVPDVRFPELRQGIPVTTSLAALRQLFEEAGLDPAGFGSAGWNPLADLVRAGARVLVKPNWVHHAWPSRSSLDCLVTHTHLIEAVLAYLEKVPGCSVVLGDAPVQGCDFGALLRACGIDELVPRYSAQFAALEVVDFRKTIWGKGVHGDRSRCDCRGDQHFVGFDLADASHLEDISRDAHRFRVTVYNPDLLIETHSAGRHRYLVAREALDADFVINLPKLKTHRKTGITGALKNVVGINGHKEYLPHHRKGGSARGGDCYPGGSWLKAVAEDVLDFVNRSESQALFRVGSVAAATLARLNAACGGDDGLEGSWPGNDTIWRTVLDLQRILHYGRSDGSIAGAPQRQVLTITDAVICGEGEGPLQPTPKPLGLLTMSLSSAAAELLHAYLMGLDYLRVPIVREALACRRWPLLEGGAREVRVVVAGKVLDPPEAGRRLGSGFTMPQFWAGHCELPGVT